MTTAESAISAVRSSRRRGLLQGAREIWGYRDLLRHLVARELKVKYKRSVLGWVWSLAHPLLVAAVFTVVFSFFLRIPPPIGDPSGLHSYGLFFLCGLLSWNFLNLAISQGIGSVLAGADLIKKVYFPRAILPLAQLFAIMVSMVIEIFVILALVLLLGGKLGPALIVLPGLIFLQALFSAGLGMLFAGLNVFFRDLQHLVGILLMIWFYGTPILYPIETVPETVTILGVNFPSGAVLAANPMTAFVGAFRDAIYHSRFPPGESWIFMAASSVLVLIVCFAIFRKLETRFAEEV